MDSTRVGSEKVMDEVPDEVGEKYGMIFDEAKRWKMGGGYIWG